MQNEEYYKAVLKVTDNWLSQYSSPLQAAVRMASGVQDSFQLLADIERSIGKFRTLQDQIQALSISFHRRESGLEQFVRQNNHQMRDVLASCRAYEDLSTQLYEKLNKRGETLRVSVEATTQLAGVTAALQNQFSLITRAALLSRQSLARVELWVFSDITRGAHETYEALRRPLLEMTQSHRSLWETFRVGPQRLFLVPSVVTEAPTIETYLATHLVEVSTMEAEVRAEDQEFLTEIEASTQYILDIIASVDPDLVGIYQGAIHAIESTNMDRGRHAAVSLRELVTQILHKVAPDEDFLSWNKNERNLHNGRPTRRGRLLYICRCINNGAFTQFVEKDIFAQTEFLKLLEEGTHAVKLSYDDTQLKALLIRTECLIDFIIRIAREAQP